MNMNNIETIEQLVSPTKVNEAISSGWVLLAVTLGQDGDYVETIYTIGMRRMWKCGCGKPMTTFINETNRWRCDDPTHAGNPA